MVDAVQPTLWSEIDRIALCIHRPSSADPEFREVVGRLELPAGSVVVVAARHLAAGRLIIQQLELLARYDSRSLVRLNAQHHVELGLLTRASQEEFVPSEPFRAAAETVLRVQGRAAEELWAGAGDITDLVTLAANLVTSAATSPPAPVPAFLAQIADHETTPSSAAGQLLAYVTELRYLRSDLHAHALASHGLAGPTARLVDRLWKGNHVEREDLDRMKSKGLVEESAEGWRLTRAARHARELAEVETNTLTRAALAFDPGEAVALLEAGLSRLAGDDPRPPDSR